MVFDPCASMVVYPSDGLAADINQAKLLPLMKRIPGLKEELQRPRAFRSDRYNFSNLVSYFQGAGSRIISKSCKIVCADECDDWVEPPRINNMKELEKRRRSYSSSIFYQVCSPTTENRKDLAGVLEELSRLLASEVQRLWKAHNEELRHPQFAI